MIRVEVLDNELEGKLERIGFEDSWKLGYERGGMRRIQIARAVYKIVGAADEPTKMVTAPAPKELSHRSLLAPELIARILVSKFVLGVPFARQESLYRIQGESLERGTMCRYAEDAGATLGAIVQATWFRPRGVPVRRHKGYAVLAASTIPRALSPRRGHKSCTLELERPLGHITVPPRPTEKQ